MTKTASIGARAVTDRHETSQAVQIVQPIFVWNVLRSEQTFVLCTGTAGRRANAGRRHIDGLVDEGCRRRLTPVGYLQAIPHLDASVVSERTAQATRALASDARYRRGNPLRVDVDDFLERARRSATNAEGIRLRRADSRGLFERG